MIQLYKSKNGNAVDVGHFFIYFFFLLLEVLMAWPEHNHTPATCTAGRGGGTGNYWQLNYGSLFLTGKQQRVKVPLKNCAI